MNKMADRAKIKPYMSSLIADDLHEMSSLISLHSNEMSKLSSLIADHLHLNVKSDSRPFT